MNYSLRNAEDKDRPWIEALRREVYKELFNQTWGGWDEARHQRHFSAFLEDRHIQIIEISTAPVGILQVFESDNEIKVGEIQILPACQGQGLGSKVLNDIIERAKKSSKSLVLATGLKNAGALKLYKKLGFAKTARTETHVNMVYSPSP